MTLRKEIRHYETIPKGYGIAYRRYDMQAVVCYPFPLNHIIRFLLDVWNKIRHAKATNAITEAYCRGREEERVFQETRLYPIVRKHVLDLTTKAFNEECENQRIKAKKTC